jgi:hypothetical protein
MTSKPQTRKVAVRNIVSPGSLRNVDAAKYEAMRTAVLTVLPAKAPGRTIAEVQKLVVSHLPEDLYPGGAKAGWWMKTVQLDLEAKGTIVREKTTPLRLYRS